MARLKDITFESNSLTGTDGADSVVGSPTLQSGANALKGSYSALANAATTYCREDFTGVDTIFVSFYFKLHATPATTARIMTLANTGGGTSALPNIAIGSDTTVRVRAGSTALGTNQSISLDTLYRVGLRYTKGSGTNAIIEGFLAVGDAAFGAAFGSTTTNTLTDQIGRVHIGSPTSDPINATFDDVRIDDASMPGPSLTAADGAAAVTISITAAATPTVEVPGAGTATVALTAEGTGGILLFAEGTATVAITAEGTGEAPVAGAGTATVAMTATATPTVEVPGAGMATVAITAVATGTLPVAGAGAATVAITAQATGALVIPPAAAAVSVAITAQATASVQTHLLTAAGPSQLQIVVFQSATGAWVADWSWMASDASITTNEHGDAALEAFIAMSATDALDWYERLAAFHIEVLECGCLVWEGRLEDVALVAGGIRITALGYWRALSDTRHTALWSTTSLDEWRPVRRQDMSSRIPDRYEMEIRNGLYIAIKQNAIADTSNMGSVSYTPPDGYARLIRAITFDYTLTAPAPWTADVGTQDRNYGGGVSRWALVGNGGTQSGSVSLAFPGAERLTVTFYPNTNTPTTFTGQTGEVFLDIFNLRVLTVATPTLTADAVASGLISEIAAINPTQLRTSTVFLQSPGLDLSDEVYEDEEPAAIITRLIELGDTQTPPRVWRAQVAGRGLRLAPEGDSTISQSWLVEVDDESFEAQQSLDALINVVYATYTDPDGRRRRTATATDSSSVSRYGLTRVAQATAQTTEAAQAAVQRDLALADHKLAPPRVRLPVRRVLTPTLAPARWWEVKAGDRVTILNMPLTSTALDQLQTFIVAETSYDFGRSISVTPATPPPRLAVIQEQRGRGLR